MTVKAIMAWAGIVDGKIHVSDCPTFDGYGDGRCNRPALFKSRKDARREYQKVTRVRVTEVKPKKPQMMVLAALKPRNP